MNGETGEAAMSATHEADNGQEHAAGEFELPSYHGGGYLVDILDKEALAEALGDNDRF